MSRWVLELTGQVQGVGCRDFVRAVAQRLGLVGSVWNYPDDPSKVGVVVQGPEPLLRSFVSDISGVHGSIAVVSVRTLSLEGPDPSLLAFTRISSFL